MRIHLIFIAAVLGTGLAIGWAFLPGDWYAGLRKPFFTPPNWLFGPAWTVLYILIGIAGARTWTRTWARDRQDPGLRLWLAQMGLNFLWSPAFFGAEAPALGLIVIVALLAMIAAFIVNRWDRDRIAAWLFLPYAAWVAFATALNAGILWLN